MRAISQSTLGEPSVLHEVEVERPQVGAGQILVAVRAAGVNPADGHHRRSGLFLGEPPFTLGWDVSGVVKEVGVGVSLFCPGDEVFGMLPFPYGAGAYAEYVVGPVRAFVGKPEVISHVEAAALPLAALTAWQALVDTARVEPDQRVLVLGAAGGVGHLAVQIAKARGAVVVGTASASKLDFIRGLGVDEAIDYQAGDITEVRDVDIVLAFIGGDDRLRSLETLKPGGVLVTSVPDEEFSSVVSRATELDVRAAAVFVEHDRAAMEGIASLVADGRLRPVIADVYPLSDAAKAHSQIETGRVSGKLVLTTQR